MGRPVVSSWAAVNPTIQPGGAPQIRVNFTPAADNKNLWFRFDLKQGSDSWLESDWISVPNKNAGSITLTYVRNGVQAIPGDWGGSKQIPLQAKLMWGEDGRGRGGEIGRKSSLFVIGISGGDSVSGGTTLGTKPTNCSAVAVSSDIPRGGPAKLRFTYDSDVSGFLRFDLRPDKGLGATGTGSIFPSTWIEGRAWTHIDAGAGKQVELTYPNVPTDWSPSGSGRVNYIDAQVCWSSSGGGKGDLLWSKAKVFHVVESQATGGGSDTGNGETNGGSGSSDGSGETNGGNGGTDTNGSESSTTDKLSKWLKDNWMIALLIGALALLVIPGRSSKGD